MKKPSLLRRLLLSAFRIAVISYGFACGYLYFFQNSMIYPRKLTGVDLPRDKALAQAASHGLVPITLPGHTDFSGYTTSHGSTGVWRGTIVVFHGNGAWAGQRTDYVAAFEKRGFHVAFAEYPGYGGRTGRPSEKIIVPEARELIRDLAQQPGNGPIYLWGESLGSGVASAVAADPTLPVHGLVIMTAWDTLTQVGYSYYPYIPVGLLMEDRYDSIGNLKNFRHPIVVVRCTLDEIIPPALTLDLFAHLPEPKKMIVMENVGHADWPDDPNLPWWDEALDFMAPNLGAHSTAVAPAPGR